MAFFNAPYKLFLDANTMFYDTFINSLTETFMLFLNLVLSHSMYVSPSMSLKTFYAPKLAISACIFLGLWAWSFADMLEFEAFAKQDFVANEEAQNYERGCFTFFLMFMIVYTIMATYYSIKALSTDINSSRIKQRFKNQASILVLIVSGCTVSLVVFPFESQTLQFLNENGVVNIYMIVLSYMLSPNTQMDEEITIDEDGHVSVI